MGFMKQDPVITPNLDMFASQGKVLSNAVSSHPLCSPYRASLLTGRYPHDTGVPVNCHSSRPEVKLRLDLPTISEVLAANNYSCGYIGKWHLEAPHKPYVNGKKKCYAEYCPQGPRRRKFSYFLQAEGNYFQGQYWDNDDPREKPRKTPKWCAEHETDVAIDYIKNKGGKYRNSNKPFFLMLSWRPPHAPFQVPEKYLKLYKKKTIKDLLVRKNVKITDKNQKYLSHVREYFAMVTGIDEQFGRIMKVLKKQGLEKNTIVIYSADHGEMLGSHGWTGKNRIYDESFRIPFIIRWPGHIKSGTDKLHFNVPDTMPTLLSLAGLKDKTPKTVQGTDYSKLLLSQDMKRPDSALYMHCYKDWRRGLRTDKYTYQLDYQGKEMLFNNQEDPFQNKNIAKENSKICDQMIEKIRDWQKKIDDNIKLVTPKRI
jgi:arylsulfatase A-like enzyme